MIDMISHGQLVSGFVRGSGRESWAHNSPPHFNRERFEDAHDLIIKAWTEPGPGAGRASTPTIVTLTIGRGRCRSRTRRSGFRPLAQVRTPLTG